MSISFDGALEVIDLDVEDLIGLTELQITDKITPLLPEKMTPDEMTTLMEGLRLRLEEVQIEIEELKDGYNESIDELDDDATTSLARYELRIQECEEAIDALDIIDAGTEAALAHEALLNKETSEDLTWTYDTSDLDTLNENDAVNIKATGVANSTATMFEDEEEAPLTDTNLDGFITFADSEVIAEGTDQFANQDIFLQINSGDKIKFVSQTGNLTKLQITTAEGKLINLSIDGLANVYYTGGDYMAQSDLDGVPDDVLKRWFDNSDPQSMYDKLHEDDMSDAERLAYIPDYNDVVNQTNFDAIVSTYSLTGAAFEDYSAILKDLYTWIDNTDSTKEGIGSVWNQIYLDYGELSPDLVTALIMGVATNGDQSTFQTFFATVVGKLETSLGYDAAAEEDLLADKYKVPIMFAEMYSGAAGQLGGADLFWDTAFAKDLGDGTYQKGAWSDHDSNVSAITMYQNAMLTVDWAVSGGQEEATKATEAATKNQEDIENGDTEAVFTQEELKAMRTEMTNLVETEDSSIMYSWTYWKDNWADAASAFMGALFSKDANGDWEMNDPFVAYESVRNLNSSDGGHSDTVAANFLYALKAHCPTLAAVIFNKVATTSKASLYDKGDSFVDYLWSRADEDQGIGDKPTAYTEARTVWQEYS